MERRGKKQPGSSALLHLHPIRLQPSQCPFRDTGVTRFPAFKSLLPGLQFCPLFQPAATNGNLKVHQICPPLPRAPTGVQLRAPTEARRLPSQVCGTSLWGHPILTPPGRTKEGPGCEKPSSPEVKDPPSHAKPFCLFSRVWPSFKIVPGVSRQRCHPGTRKGRVQVHRRVPKLPGQPFFLL